MKEIDTLRLLNAYLKEKKSLRETGDLFGVSLETIRNKLKKLGVKARSREEARELQKQSRLYWNRDWLLKKYETEKKSLNMIAKEVSTSNGVIHAALVRSGIPRRTKSQGKTLLIPDFKLSERSLQFLEGELLGDMNISPRSRSARIHYGSKYPQYLSWLSGQLKAFGIEQSGKIQTKNSAWGISYAYTSLSYLSLKKIYKRFYPDRKKIIPKSFTLSPLGLRQWIIGDGTFAKKGKGGLTFCTECFSDEDIQILIQQLQNFDLLVHSQPITNDKLRIYLSAYSLRKLFQIIGPCPLEIEGIYGYKWEYMKRNENQLGLGNFLKPAV